MNAVMKGNIVDMSVEEGVMKEALTEKHKNTCVEDDKEYSKLVLC